MWAAAELVPGSPITTERWAPYLKSPGTSLFARAYDAIGFFGHLADVGIDVWPRLVPMMQAPDDAAAFAIGVAGNPAALDDWPAGLAREPAYGASWDTSGPDIPATTPPRLHRAVANGKSASGSVPKAANVVLDLDVGADVVTFAISASARGRLRDAGGTDRLLAGVSGLSLSRAPRGLRVSRRLRGRGDRPRGDRAGCGAARCHRWHRSRARDGAGTAVGRLLQAPDQGRPVPRRHLGQHRSGRRRTRHRHHRLGRCGLGAHAAQERYRERRPRPFGSRHHDAARGPRRHVPALRPHRRAGRARRMASCGRSRSARSPRRSGSMCRASAVRSSRSVAAAVRRSTAPTRARRPRSPTPHPASAGTAPGRGPEHATRPWFTRRRGSRRRPRRRARTPAARWPRRPGASDRGAPAPRSSSR